MFRKLAMLCLVISAPALYALGQAESNSLASEAREIVKQVEGISPSSFDMAIIDQWINTEPADACNELIKLSRGGNLRANVLLGRVLAQQRDLQEVREMLIPYYLYDFDESDLNYGTASSQLMEFRADEYTSQSKELIRIGLHKPNHETRYTLACGAAGMKSEIPFLKSLIDEAANSQPGAGLRQQVTFIRMALARLGDRESLDWVIDEVRPLVNESLNSIVMPLQHIGYLRHPESIDFLKVVLFSDVDEYCLPSPVDHRLPAQPYAFVALDVLTKCLTDFPIEWKTGRTYDEADLAVAREWMARQTEWKIIR